MEHTPNSISQMYLFSQDKTSVYYCGSQETGLLKQNTIENTQQNTLYCDLVNLFSEYVYFTPCVFIC